MTDKNVKFKWMIFKPRELEIKRKTSPPFEQWTESIGGFDQQLQSAPFWRGDLFNKGLEWYGDAKATSIFDPLTTNVKTWQNNASICRRVEAPRRREELSYSHHAEVAYLKDESAQDRYLQIAIDNMLSVRKLRELIRSEEEGEEINFRKRPLDKFLEQEANKIGNRKDEAEGEVLQLMQTAVESLMDAFEIVRDDLQMDQAA